MRRFIFGGVLMFMVTFSQAQELPVILEKHFDAHGQDLWNQVGTVTIDGYWVTKEFYKYPMKLTYKSPGKIRIDGMWGSKKYAEVTNGQIAWTVAPWTGTSKVQLMTPLEHLTISNIYRPGSALEPYCDQMKLAGLELFEGELFIKLFWEDQNTKREFYLGKDDYILYWEVIHSKVGKRYTVKKQYEKYQNKQGLLAPTAIRIFTDENERELIFEDIALGIGAPNSLFEMPESP